MKSSTVSEEEEDGFSESYSDLAVDPIDLPGIALNPMVTTVYSMVRWDPRRSRHKVLYASRPARSCDQHKKPPLPKYVDYRTSYNSSVLEEGAMHMTFLSV